jgi:hypothetical protein
MSKVRRRNIRIYQGVGTSEKEEDIRKGGQRVNMVGIFCTHICK